MAKKKQYYDISGVVLDKSGKQIGTMEVPTIAERERVQSTIKSQPVQPTDLRTIDTNKLFEQSQQNLKNADNEFKVANDIYQNRLKQELDKTGIDYRTQFPDITKNKISYQTKDEDKPKNQPEVIPIAEARNNLQNELNARQEAYDRWKIANYENNLARVQNEESTLFDKTLGTPIRAIKDLVSPLTLGEDITLKDETGNKTFLPSYNELKQQQVRQDTTGLAGAAQDIMYNATKVLGAGALDAVTGGIGGKALYWTDMSADNYMNAKNQGATNGQAIANTLISTGSEYLTEKLLGGLTKELTGGQASEVQNAVSNSVNKLIKNPKVANIIGSMGSEGLEEWVQEWIGALNDRITLGEELDVEQTLKDSLYSALIGAGSGGTITATNNIEGRIAANNSNILNERINTLKDMQHMTTNENTKAKIDESINKANEYISKPFGKDVESVMNESDNDMQEIAKLLRLEEKESQQTRQQETPQTAPKVENNVNVQEEAKTEPTTQETAQKEQVEEKPSRKVGNRDYSSSKYDNLSDEDIRELDRIYEGYKQTGKISEEDNAKLDILSKKANYIKNPEINTNINEFKDVSKDYTKYGKKADLENFDTTMTQKAKETIEGNKQGRRTKEQWLDVAKNIGMQAENLDSEALKKYAFASFMHEKPNQKQNLNRQGQKYVSFGVQDWVKAVYEGAGVGKQLEKPVKTEVKQPVKTETKENIPEEKAKEPVLKVETKGEKGKQFFEEQGAKPEVAKILSETPRKEKPTLKEKTKNFIENQKNSLKEFRRSFVDKGQEIADIDRAVKDNGKTYAKYDFLALSEANAQYQIGDGQTTTDGKLFKNFTDKNGNKVSKSLKGLWEDVDNAGLKDVMDEYIAHYLNTDVYGRPTASSQREIDSTLNMVESGFISPEEAKSIIDENKKIQSVFGEAVTKKDSLKRIKEIEQQHPEIKRLAENIWQYGYNELDKMVDSGRVSKADAEKFKKENPHYVRLQRKVEQTKKSQDIFDINKKADVSVGKGIQERKGGTQDILPFRDTMADFTRFNARQSRMNNFGLKLAKVLNTNIDANDSLVSTDESGVKLGDTIKKNDNGTYTFRIYENGKPKQIYINEGIYEALQPNKKYKFEKWLPFKATSKLSKVQRDLITGKNLLFSTTNAPKDLFNALFSTRNSSPQFLKNYFKAYVELAKNGNYAQQYKALGGNQNTYYNYEEGYIKDKSKIKALKAGQSIINGIEKINNFVETAPRLAEFISSMENGKSIEDAMYDAAEVTTNFKRGGNVTKAIDRVGANYFSPSVQGASKFVRNFSEAIENKQYAKILTRVALMGLGPALVGEIMWGDDEDYIDLPEYQKDNYYLWKTGEGKWIRIPKGQIQGALQAPIRRTIAATRGQEDAYSGLTDTFLNNVAPNNPLEDNVLGPMISVARNKSWSGNPIVPSYKENKKHPEVEYTSGTDELSKYLGEKLHKSPAKINYLLDQYTGGIGDLVLPNITNKTTQENNNALAKVTNPLKSKFTTDTTYSNKAQGNFYDALEEAKNDNDKRWKGRTEADSVRYKYLYSKNLELAEINKQIEEVQSSNIDKDEKYKQVAELRKKLNNLAKESVKESKNIKENEYYMQIDDYYYYKYKEKDGSITYKKATDKQLEKNKYALADYFKEMYEKSTKR